MMTLLITFFMVSMVFSFLCSLWEAALLSITPTYAEIQLQEGSAIGKHLTEFKTNIDRPLAAILTLNTIAHTAGAIGVGAQASIIWADAHPAVTGFLVPAAMTLAILLISEIIPKTLGASYWKELAGFTINSLIITMTLLAPLIWLCQQVTGRLKKNTEGSIFSRSDFLAMAEIGLREGIFEKNESEMISNLIQFESVSAQDIMTPRTVVIAFPEDMSIASCLDTYQPIRVSRIPIYQNNSKDDVTGYILKDTLLTAMLEGRGDDLVGSLTREIMIVKEDFPLPELFNRLVVRKEHIALVVDHFGGMAGIVTMEDAIETLLGREIVDESDKEADLRVRARKEWEIRAKARGLVQETYHE
jgi:CBS domain containing-hemolysin-like protein